MSTNFLSQIQYTDLISISHIEAKIKLNFELIVKQLMNKQQEDSKRDQSIKQLQQSLSQLTQRTQRGSSKNNKSSKDENHKHFHIINNINGKDDHGSFQGNKINNDPLSQQQNPQLAERHQNQPLSFDEMEDKLLSSQKQITQLKQFKMKLQEDINKLKQQLESHINNKIVHGNSIQLQNKLEKRFNQLQQQMKSISAQNNNYKNIQQNMQDELSKLYQLTNEISSSTTTNQHQIQSKITGILSQIESIKSKQSQQSNSNNQSTNKLVRKQGSTLPSPSEISLSSLEDKIKRTNIDLVINLKQIKQIKNDINDLKSLRNTKSLVDPDIYQNGRDYNQVNKIDGLISKMNQLKKEHQTSFKALKDQLGEIINSIPDYSLLTDMINQIKLQLGKKADQDGTKKMLVYLENRLNWLIEQLFKQSEDDARVGKTSWNCLSCDRGLKQFRGKIGQHLIGDAMKGKKLQKTKQKELLISNSEALRMKSRSKIQLPKVQKLIEKFEKLDTMR